MKKVLFFDWMMKQYFVMYVILNRMWNLDYVCVRFKVGKFYNNVIVKCVNNKFIQVTSCSRPFLQ